MAPSTRHPEPLPSADDPALLVQAIALLLGERTLRDAIDAGCPGLRASDGYVFQHLVPGPLTIRDLATRLEITQQGASKAVADLERRGFVHRIEDPADARRRPVALTDRGLLAVHQGRRTRASVARQLRRRLGGDDYAAFVRSLRAVTDSLGGFAALEGRRLRAPS